MKIRVISKTIASLVLFAINFIEKKFVEKVPNDDVRAGLKLLLNPIRGMVNALSDENPRNAEQIAELWKKWAGNDLVNFGDARLQVLIGNIENDQLRRPLSIIVVPTLNMVRIFTDDNPNNVDQLKENWLSFISSQETHEVVLVDLLEPALDKILDKEVVDFILAIITEALEQQFGDFGEDKAKEIAEKLKAKMRPAA